MNRTPVSYFKKDIIENIRRTDTRYDIIQIDPYNEDAVTVIPLKITGYEFTSKKFWGTVNAFRFDTASAAHNWINQAVYEDNVNWWAS